MTSSLGTDNIVEKIWSSVTSLHGNMQSISLWDHCDVCQYDRSSLPLFVPKLEIIFNGSQECLDRCPETAVSSFFFTLLHLLFSRFFQIWWQEGEYFALITLSQPISFILLTVMRQDKHSMSAHGSRRQIKRSDVKGWLLLLTQVCLSDCEGGFIPVLPTLNLGYCFSFLLRLKGLYLYSHPKTHTL